jgi:hypothetical protein
MPQGCFYFLPNLTRRVMLYMLPARCILDEQVGFASVGQIEKPLGHVINAIPNKTKP